MSRKKHLKKYHDELGPRLRSRRKEINMPIEVLASKVDVTPEYIGKLERGEARPSYEVFVGLAEALDISEDYLSMGHPGVNPKFALNNELAKATEDADAEDIRFYLEMIEAHKNYKKNKLEQQGG